MNLQSRLKFLKPYVWRLLLTALGLVAAILFITIGFLKTTLILLCCGTGCAFGWLLDKNVSITVFTKRITYKK